MKKADKDKVKQGFEAAKGKIVRVETLLPKKWKKKLAGNIEPKRP